MTTHARSRIVVRLAAVVSILSFASGCHSTPQEPEDPAGDINLISEVWGINVPEGAKIKQYYSSSSDFQGGRDDIYILEVPAESRSGYWGAGEFTSAPPPAANGVQSPYSIRDASGAPLADPYIQGLSCRPPQRQNQDYLISCYDAEEGDFLLFEEIF